MKNLKTFEAFTEDLENTIINEADKKDDTCKCEKDKCDCEEEEDEEDEKEDEKE
jgi:hypothetical protein